MFDIVGLDGRLGFVDSRLDLDVMDLVFEDLRIEKMVSGGRTHGIVDDPLDWNQYTYAGHDGDRKVGSMLDESMIDVLPCEVDSRSDGVGGAKAVTV